MQPWANLSANPRKHDRSEFQPSPIYGSCDCLNSFPLTTAWVYFSVDFFSSSPRVPTWLCGSSPSPPTDGRLRTLFTWHSRRDMLHRLSRCLTHQSAVSLRIPVWWAAIRPGRDSTRPTPLKITFKILLCTTSTELEMLRIDILCSVFVKEIHS